MNILRNIWARIKRLFGYPTPPRPEQVGEKLVTMREPRDCAVAALATACEISYEAAHKALFHSDLPFFLESPLMSNPKWLRAAIERAGFKADDTAKITQLINGDLPSGKTICLVHNPVNAIFATLQSHWVVFMGINQNNEYMFHWGQKQDLRCIKKAELVETLTAGWPNCCIVIKKKC